MKILNFPTILVYMLVLFLSTQGFKTKEITYQWESKFANAVTDKGKVLLIISDKLRVVKE